MLPFQLLSDGFDLILSESLESFEKSRMAKQESDDVPIEDILRMFSSSDYNSQL